MLVRRLIIFWSSVFLARSLDSNLMFLVFLRALFRLISSKSTTSSPTLSKICNNSTWLQILPSRYISILSTKRPKRERILVIWNCRSKNLLFPLTEKKISINSSIFKMCPMDGVWRAVLGLFQVRGRSLLPKFHSKKQKVRSISRTKIIIFANTSPNNG